MQIVILAAGEIDYTQLYSGHIRSSAMISVSGMPLIIWTLNYCRNAGLTDVRVVVDSEDNRLIKILNSYYCPDLNLEVVRISKSPNILESLRIGLKNIDRNVGVQVLLGDTLVNDTFGESTDAIFVGIVNESKNWCVVDLDNEGNVLNFLDKSILTGDEFTAVCGYYKFSDSFLLNELVNEACKIGEIDLSFVLDSYSRKHKLTLIYTKNWLDFGHHSAYVESKKSMVQPRYFNTISIQGHLGIISKKSFKKDKLLDEANWYQQLPPELSIIAPRLLKVEEKENYVEFFQEFYGYPCISELFVYHDLGFDIWKRLLGVLFKINSDFKRYQMKASISDLESMYKFKTYERIELLIKSNNYWFNIWSSDVVVINDKVYKNISYCLESLEVQIQSLNNIEYFHIVHGDFCISNILYDINNEIVRLVDPRGSFGSKGIYGDSRYDIAKLRHSFVGNYDFIIADLFCISETREFEFEYSIFNAHDKEEFVSHFDKLVELNGYNLQEIKLIEALLFVSMIPYHSDKFDRQKLMYLKAVLLLNDLL